MEYKDYYKILGVEKSVGKEALKSRYRKLARQFHPDVNTTDKDAATRFAEISEAYDVLSDDDKRRKYDSLGSDWERFQTSEKKGDGFDWSKYASPGSGQERGGGQDWKGFFERNAGSDPSDFFKNLFGQEFRGRADADFARKGQDVRAVLPITLEEAFSGGVQTLVIGERKIRLTLKPGIWDHQTIEIGGRGSPGVNGGPDGNLYITFLLQPHQTYRLDGTSLFMDLPVSVYAALLGTTQEVKTISGSYKIKIPPETRDGTVFKLKGRGFPVYDKPGDSGDLFLKVALQLPEKLDSREKELVRELAAIRNVKVGGEAE